jgi:hypothetical protein
MRHKLIPFDIEKYHSSKYKLTTRAGYKVRIICEDCHDDNYKGCPIVALCDYYSNGNEHVCHYDANGRYYGRDYDENEDLFLITDDEMVYNGWEDAIQKLLLAQYKNGISNKELKRISDELLNLATNYVTYDYNSGDIKPCNDIDD